jgi:F0F1-type ATP synthase delta subunit
MSGKKSFGDGLRLAKMYAVVFAEQIKDNAKLQGIVSEVKKLSEVENFIHLQNKKVVDLILNDLRLVNELKNFLRVVNVNDRLNLLPAIAADLEEIIAGRLGKNTIKVVGCKASLSLYEQEIRQLKQGVEPKYTLVQEVSELPTDGFEIILPNKKKISLTLNNMVEQLRKRLLSV